MDLFDLHANLRGSSSTLTEVRRLMTARSISLRLHDETVMGWKCLVGALELLGLGYRIGWSSVVENGMLE